jgi:TPR repeat protein
MGNESSRRTKWEEEAPPVKTLLLEGVVPDQGTERNGAHLLPIRKLIEFGDPEAQLQLGIRFKLGIGVHEDYSRGWEFITRSAHSGHPVSLALCCYFGQHIGLDQKRAAELLQQSAERGHAVGNEALSAHTLKCIAIC